ncbi:MAG: ComF family protein [Clostridia bacterium]|nr:ComF family protein [Clostridia bacterium]
MIYILDFLLSLIYPNVCGFCGKINQNSLCEDCEKKLDEKLIYKIDKKENKNFEKHIYLARYEGEFRKEILNYKFADKPYMYKTFSKLILKNEKICEIIKSYDIITEVPIHKKRKKERGYNQSELISKEIAKNIENIKHQKLLVKARNNKHQSILKKEERQENVKNAYEVQNRQIIKEKRIVLFDDIYTTGDTTNECSYVLKQNGAREILVLTLAR